MTTRPNLELLGELRATVEDQPRQRLHVHPEAAMWITVGIQRNGLSEHVQVVADPDCLEIGKGWIETLTVEQWRSLRTLVGLRVDVSAESLGRLTGVLLKLSHGEAVLDLGGGDVRYLRWLSVESADDGA